MPKQFDPTFETKITSYKAKEELAGTSAEIDFLGTGPLQKAICKHFTRFYFL